ncbi:hypothetical protein AB0M36_15620 [Actinoplanes sp. NPDC051346]|uniref:hypothetical protein n=1 Tax=Actinoplanes sp. NPDC051346 TaxID=3155048 RepID=UPI003432A83F
MIFRSLFQGRDRDDSGTLAMAVLATVIGMMLSALLMPIILTQVTSARHAVQRDHALHAAQAGLDATIGRIRGARDNNTGTGDLGKLPCDPVEGDVDATGTAQYHVTIIYLPEDPHGKPESWINPNKLLCFEGSGLSSIPSFALLISKGTDRGSGSRTLQGTYTFSTAAGLQGGGIEVPSSKPGLRLCLAADSGSPAAGDPVKLARCEAGAPEQSFIYENLTLVLVASRTAAMPFGMCLDALDGKAASERYNVIRFQPCIFIDDPIRPGVTKPPPHQEWPFWEPFYRGTDDGLKPNSFCFKVQIPDVEGSNVILDIGCGSHTSPLPAGPQTTFSRPTNLTGPLKDLSEK